jgi:hypothetical protein
MASLTSWRCDPSSRRRSQSEYFSEVRCRMLSAISCPSGDIAAPDISS